MIDRFEIVDSDSPRPAAKRIVFCDGTGGDLFQAETDLELSHWRPNRTLPQYRAGTSAEICYRFLDDPPPGAWTAAVNNHVDVDGILSVYVLIHSEHALQHRRTIIQAAEMGDFWGWGEPPAQRVFQGLTLLMRRQNTDPRARYAEAFRRISGLIEGSDPEVPEIEASLAPLRHEVAMIERGEIVRREVDARLVHYIVPLAEAGTDDARAAYVPGFNEAISPQALLWPQARARWDAEKVCLVSVERNAGWFHDLCFPGYLWADTEGLWLVPGMTYHDGMSSYELQNATIVDAFQTLQQQEAAPGTWCLGGTNLPFGDALQEQFPVVGRFLDRQGQPTVSQTRPEDVARAIEGIFSLA